MPSERPLAQGSSFPRTVPWAAESTAGKLEKNKVKQNKKLSPFLPIPLAEREFYESALRLTT